MIINYEDWVTKYSDNFVRVRIDDEYADKIEKEAQEAQKECDRVFSHTGITAGTSLEVGRVLNSNKNVSENKLLDIWKKKK
jgi:hypothetical protein